MGFPAGIRGISARNSAEDGRMEVRNQPIEDGLEESAHVDTVEPREDGKKTLVEGVLRRGALGDARDVDMKMVVGEGVVADGGIEEARTLHPSTEGEAAEFSG